MADDTQKPAAADDGLIHIDPEAGAAPTTVHIDPDAAIAPPNPNVEVAIDPRTGLPRASLRRVGLDPNQIAPPQTRAQAAGPTLSEAPEPGVGERLKRVVTEGIPNFSTRGVNDPKYGQEQFLAPEELLSPHEQREHPVLTGALESAGGLTSPANLGIAAATGGAGESAVVGKVLSGIFAGEIASSVYEQYPALKAAVDKAQNAKTKQEHDDAFAEAQRLATHMGVDTLMGLLAAKHGSEGAKEILDKTTSSGIPDPESTFKAPKVGRAPEPEETHPEMNRDTVKALQNLGYSSQHISQFNISEIRDILKKQTPAAEYKFPQDSRQWNPNEPAKPTAVPKPAPAPDAMAEVGGKLVSPSADTSAPAETAATTETPEETRDLVMSDKIGGKKVLESPTKESAMVVGQQAKPEIAGLKERTTGSDEGDAHIKAAGAIPAGNMMGLSLFHDPKTGSTLALKSEEVTPERVQQQLANSRKSYGLAPEPDALNAVQGSLVGKQPEAATKYHPDLQKVLDISGPLHTDPSQMIGRPSFLTPDGKISNLPAGLQHPQVISQALGQTHDFPNNDVRPKFLDDTGAVRVRFHGRFPDNTLAFSVPKTGVTPEQIDMMKQGVGQNGRNGGLSIERSDTNENNWKQVSKHKDFARPADVDDLLKEIGAHPDQSTKEMVTSTVAHSPFKQDYTMAVTDKEGAERVEKVQANTPREALQTIKQKFPQASDWRLQGWEDQSGASPKIYSVPSEKLQSMPDDMERTPVHAVRHELGHVFMGAKNGLVSKGMVSEHHPASEGDMRAGVLWELPKWVDGKGNIEHEHLPKVIDMFLGGIAADEVFNDLPRSANYNLRTNVSGSDGHRAYTVLKAAGYTHEEAIEFMHAKIDQAVDHLQQPHISSIIKENENFREPGLSHQFHYSPDRLKSMVAESDRRKTNGETKQVERHNDRSVDASRNQNGPADVAGAEGTTPKESLGLAEDGEDGVVSASKIAKPKGSPEKTIPEAIDKFNKAHGRSAIDAENLPGVDARADQMAEWYKNAEHNPNDPAVKKSYTALKRDVDEQYDLAKKLGIRLEPVEGDTYDNAYAGLREDVNKNRNVKVWRGGEFPKDHPLSETDPKTGMTYYEKLLGIHDLFGHFAHDKDFSLAGEENAWNMHRQMFSPEAQPALANETRVRGAYSAKYEKYDSKAAVPPEHFQTRSENLGHLQEGANKFNRAQGRAPIDAAKVADEPRLKQIGEAYAAAKHEPENPAVKKSYAAMKKDIDDQYDMAVAHGYSFDAQEHDPYEGEGVGNEKDAYHQLREDAMNNRHVSAWKGAPPPVDHPLSEVDPKTGLTYNEKFRAIHDLFGHVLHDNDFTTAGEENAWNTHRQMFSPEALPALATETRGQLGYHNRFGDFADQRATILPERYQVRATEAGPEWHETAGKAAAKDEAGGIDPRTGKSDTKGTGTEIMPELRQNLDHAPTANDFKKFYDQHREIFDAHPELRVGWDNNSAVPGGHEINVGAVGPDAKRVAKKLDQKSAFNIAKGEVVPTGGAGLRTSFPNYPIEERIKDLNSQHQSDIEGFEHLTKSVYDSLEPDERKYLEGDKTLQRNVMSQYHKIDPSVAETTNAMQAGAALGGWWRRYIDVFHGLVGDNKTIGGKQPEGKLLYHGTRGNFEQFDPLRGGTSGDFGSHFGTLAQASSRLYPSGLDDVPWQPKGDNIRPTYVNIKNPLRLEDYGDFEPNSVIAQLEENGIITTKQGDALQTKPGSGQYGPIKLRDLLEKQGYDGIVYLNRHEGVNNPDYEENGADDEDFLQRHPEAAGNDAYIAFRPEQITPKYAAEHIARIIGPSHAEVLKQWHSALSGNKAVQDANNLAWHAYADWLDAGKPTDRKSIDDIVRKNGAQPEGSGKKGNAALSDTLTRSGKVKSKGLDTHKLFLLINSPEMRGERPFSGNVFDDDGAKNPLMGPTEGARKIPSMGATTAGKGNFNRLVIDAHIRDFYGYKSSSGPAAQYIADSVHLRQAAQALGLKGGEGQEQLWGTVLGLKQLLKEGVTPAEAGGKLNADLINSIGKDYAEVIINDPEITGPGGILDRLATEHGVGVGSAGAGEAYRKTLGSGTGQGQPGSGEAAVDPALLEKTAARIRGQISESKIKKPGVSEETFAEPEEGDTSFEFGANEKPEANPWKNAPKKSKQETKINAIDLIKALSGLSKPGSKK